MSEALPPKPLALLVTRNFPPLVGGMEKVNQKLFQALGPDWRLSLVGPEGSAEFAEGAVRVDEVPLKPLAKFLSVMLVQVLLAFQHEKPALVIAGSGLTAPFAWIAARFSGAKLVVYLHGLDLVAPSLIYQRVWLPFIRACDVVLVNSSSTREMAISKGVRANRIAILNPGTDMPLAGSSDGEDFRKRHGLEGRQVLLSVGRLTRRKGLVEFVSAALPAICRECPQAILVIVGGEATDALHSSPGSETQRVLEAARLAGVGDAVLFVGRCTDEQLGNAFDAASLHVFPVLASQDDVEGFGMVALEAASHGLWTIAFAVGGVPDAVRVSESGLLLPAGHYQDMADAITDQLRGGDIPEKRLSARNFAAGKDWVAFGSTLRAALK